VRSYRALIQRDGAWRFHQLYITPSGLQIRHLLLETCIYIRSTSRDKKSPPRVGTFGILVEIWQGIFAFGDATVLYPPSNENEKWIPLPGTISLTTKSPGLLFECHGVQNCISSTIKNPSSFSERYGGFAWMDIPAVRGPCRLPLFTEFYPSHNPSRPIPFRPHPYFQYPPHHQV